MCDSGVSDSRAFAHEPFFSVFFVCILVLYWDLGKL